MKVLATKYHMIYAILTIDKIMWLDKFIKINSNNSRIVESYIKIWYDKLIILIIGWFSNRPSRGYSRS